MSILESDRLVLRALTLADTSGLLEVLGDPVAMQHYPAAKDRPQVEAWIRWALESYERNGFGLWAVVRQTDGAFLGDCGPMLQPVEGRTIPEIGYHIVRREWGRGYATEAARACLDWVFRNTDRPRVCSIVSPVNTASRRVAEKVHRDLRMFTWEKAGTEQCLYWTDRSRLADAPLAMRRTKGK